MGRRIVVRFMVMAALAAASLMSMSGAAIAAEAAPASPPAASASPVDLARSRIDTMLRTGHADPTWFSDAFLAQVRASQVDEIIANLESVLGAYQSVDFTPSKFIAHFAKGSDEVLIHLDAQSKIDGLLFRPPNLKAASLDEGLRGLRSPTGTLSYVILEEGRPDRAVLLPSEPLAVGSAFKLAVMTALQDAVAAGRLRWTDVVPLNPHWKSLPSGVLQNWPEATPITLATLATEMISISDNTAADALIRLVGREALTPYAGDNAPFLTTREVFTLKSAPGAALRAAYLRATTPDARAQVLKSADALPLPRAEALLSRPELGVEWRYSVRDLCALMAKVSANAIMGVNPGVADPAAFRRVAFKGGSDLGVINLTTAVTTMRGTKLCFSATLNEASASLDEARFETAYGGVMRMLEGD
jgi:beta-lactamase class A